MFAELEFDFTNSDRSREHFYQKRWVYTSSKRTAEQVLESEAWNKKVFIKDKINSRYIIHGQL